MGKSLFSACFGATKAVVDAERGTSTLPQHVERPPVTQLQLGEVQKWTPREVQHWLASVGLGEHAYNLEGMAGQELLELTETDVQARVPASKPAAKLTKAVQHLQRTWLQVTPAGPQPLSTSDEGTKVTILRGTASGVINVPIDSAKPSDSIKASWGPTSPSEIIAASSQFEQNASVALPSRLEAELAAERAVTEALAKDLSWYQTVIDNPLAGSRSLAGSTNTSPGAGATGHTMARSASMALAAQAAAAAAVKRQPSPLTPASLASPSHATHDYTPGSLAGSVSISRELPIPETLTSRRAELDGSQQVDAGGLEAGMSYQHSAVWQETSGDGSTALPMPNSTAEGSFLTAESVEPQALVDSLAQSQDTREQNVQSGSKRYGKQDRWQLPGLTASDAFKPEDWQNFCTKVDSLQQPGGGDAGPGDADVLQDRTDRAESFLNRSTHDADAAQEEYVKSLVTRFEKSVGPAWPARQATPRSGALGTADKENAEAVQASVKTMG